MPKKITLETEINDFLEYFNGEKIISFLRDIIPLFELYDVEDENDWVETAVGSEDVANVRLIRTVYLMSKIAENHGAVLAWIKVNHKNIWERLENER